MSKEIEMRRQIFHAIIGSIAIAVVLYAGRINAMLFTGIVFLIGCLISLLIMKEARLPIISSALKYFGRENEKCLPGKGALMFALGLFLLLMLFQRIEIIIGAMVVAVYGDAASTFVGKSIGRIKIWQEYTLEGTLGGIAVSALLLMFLFPIHVAILGAAIGMLAELLPIDDNISIPLVAATALTVLF
jgi:dolichol kinase